MMDSNQIENNRKTCNYKEHKTMYKRMLNKNIEAIIKEMQNGFLR